MSLRDDTALIAISNENKRVQIESRIAEEMAWEEYHLRRHSCGCEETEATMHFQMGLEMALNIVKEMK